MSSSRKTANKILGVVSEDRAEGVLLDVANARDDCGRVLSKYQDLFHPTTTPSLVRLYRKDLRRAWDAPDQRTRDWYIFSLRRNHALFERDLRYVEMISDPQIQGMKSQPLTPAEKEDVRAFFDAPPPAITSMEAVLFYFQTRIGDLAKHCGHVDCAAPYFIAEKRWQKFCSEACAGPANRESKRKWWHDHRGKGEAK